MFQLYTSVLLLVEPKDVVLILVSHSDSCFTIRLVDLWALYIFLFPYIQNSESYIHLLLFTKYVLLYVKLYATLQCKLLLGIRPKV